MTIPHTLASALADRYRIERELGQGGMATVYLAEDMKHGRRVAIKVLRPELAAVIGAERFVREIRTIANLQHPHILGLIDSGEVQGTAYYVMPFVEGESLRDRLSREKQLPIPDAIRLATEIADALTYAHGHGIVHRDIKPENILLHGGHAMVADFGIALAVSEAAGTRLTETGLSLGTPHYMAPEQAMGAREITGRSDVYALGCVMYEMLVGETPFTGPTAQAIIAKVITDEPTPPAAHRKTIPPEVDAAVLTALEKLPADCWGSATEFAAALTESTARPFRRTVAIRRARSRLPVVLGVLLLGATATALWGWFRPRPTTSEVPPSRLTIPAPPGGLVLGILGNLLDISDDGETIAFLANGGPGRYGEILVRRLDRAEPISLQVNASGVHLSPDGREVIYGSFNAGHLIRQRLNNDPAVPILGTDPKALVVWAPNGDIYLSGAQFGVFRLSGTGTPGQVYPADSIGTVEQVLPGGRFALATDVTASATAPVVFLDLTTGRKNTVPVGDVSGARYTQDFLIFVRPDGTMHGVGFDPDRGTIHGTPVQIAENVGIASSGFPQFEVSRNGTVVYAPEAPRGLVLVDRSGRVSRLVEKGERYHSPKFSPDGRRIAVDFPTSDGRDTWLLDRQQGTLTRVTFERDGHDPVWLPGNRGLAFASLRSGTYTVLRTSMDGRVDTLASYRNMGYTGTWFPDGRRFITVANDVTPGGSGDLIEVDSAGGIKPLLVTRFDEGWPAVSPDGRWLAFTSTLSGRQEVYVRPLDRQGEQVQVSLDGGGEPLWSRDQRELFYRRPEGIHTELVAAAVSTTPGFQVHRRTRLFPMDQYDPGQPHTNYDVSPDGRSFAMVERSAGDQIVVIQNVKEMIRRLQSGTER